MRFICFYYQNIKIELFIKILFLVHDYKHGDTFIARNIVSLNKKLSKVRHKSDENFLLPQTLKQKVEYYQT